MTPLFHTFYSNRTETLYSHLKAGLFTKTSPLSKRIIIVPSPAMKSWLTLQLAKDPDIGIAAGIEIALVEPSMRKIVQAVLQKEIQGYEPTEMELSLALEMTIYDIIKSSNRMQNGYRLLIDYLGSDLKKPSKKQTRRISALAASLAQQFTAYGIYGEKVIAEWNHNPKEWQQLLWQKMESLFAPWNYPARKLNSLTIKSDLAPEKIQIHLFGLSYFPPLYLRFLQKISAQIPISIYLLSPCQKFWGISLHQEKGCV